MSTIKNGIVELDAFEALSYWWVKRIKNLAQSIKQSEHVLDFNRLKFAQIFDFDTLKAEGYREIYLKLAKKLREQFEGHKKLTIRTSTRNKGHNEFIKWLAEIMNEAVPNINLGEFGTKEVLTYLAYEGESEPTAFVGETDFNAVRNRISTKFKPNAVLCAVKKKENKEKGDE